MFQLFVNNFPLLTETNKCLNNILFTAAFEQQTVFYCDFHLNHLIDFL